MLARFAAQARIEPAVSVCVSSTGFDWSMRVVSESRFFLASMANEVLPVTSLRSSGPRPPTAT